MLSLKYLFLILLPALTHQVVLRVSRIHQDCDNAHNFCSSTIFKSKPSTNFCQTLNGKCVDKTCTECQCKPNTVFYSYQQGCTDWKDVKNLNNGMSWIHLWESPDFVPLISPTYIRYNRQLHLLSNHVNCKLNASYVINILDGKAMPIHQPLFVEKGYYYLEIKCSTFDCYEIKRFQGALIALNFTCQTISSYTPVKAMFMLQINGTSTLSEADNFSEEDTNKRLVVYIVVPVVAVLSLILLFIFGIRRRIKSLRRKETYCAHYINEGKKEMHMSNNTYEDIHKSQSNENLDQEAENIYYQTADNQNLYVAPLQSTVTNNMNLSQDNPDNPDNPEYMSSRPSKQPFANEQNNENTEYLHCFDRENSEIYEETENLNKEPCYETNSGDRCNTNSLDKAFGSKRIKSKQNAENAKDDSIMFFASPSSNSFQHNNSQRNCENIYENKQKGYEVVGSILH